MDVAENQTEIVVSDFSEGQRFSASWDISLATYLLIHTICSDYLSTIICLVGIPANIINCLVFYRQGLRDRMNLCLFCLALDDLGLLICVFAVSSLSFFIALADTAFSNEYLMKALAGGGGVVYAFRSASGCITMIISIERCICVVFPLRATSLVRTQTMGALLGACFFFLQLAQIVLPLKVSAVGVHNNFTRKTEWYMVPTKLGVTHKELFDIMENTILSICVPIITFVVVSSATAVTVVRLKTAMKWREMSTSVSSESTSRQRALTKMLVLVSCVYIVSMVPFVAVIIARLFVEEFSPYGRSYNLYLACNTIVNQLPLVNSAVNFFLYCAQSTRYRADLRAVVGCVLRVGVRSLPSKSVSTTDGPSTL